MRHLSSCAKPGLLAGLLFLILVVSGGCTGAQRSAAALPTQTAALDVAQVEAATLLNPYLAALHDPTRQLTLADVMTPARAARFVPAGAAEPNFGLNAGAAWGRFTLTNASAQTQTTVLRLDLPTASYIDLYTPAAGGGAPPAISTGARAPYASRPLPDRLFAFPLELAPGATQTYYLRVASDLALRLPLTIWPADAYGVAVAQEVFAWALVVGLVLLLSLYNLLVFFVVRDLDHLLLGLAGAVSILTTYLANGFAAPWLGVQATSFPQIVVVMSALATLCYVALVISFLDLRRRVRWAFYALVGVAVAATGAAMISLAFSSSIGFALLLVCTPVLLIVTLVATITGVRQGYRPAVYFLAAQLVPIALGFVQSTAILGVVPWAPLFLTSVPTSELLLVVLMSLALADRINTARREVERANLALAASEQRLLQYLDALPFSVQVYSPSLDLLFSNQQVTLADAGGSGAIANRNYLDVLSEVPVRVYGRDIPYPAENIPLLRAAGGESAHADDLTVALPDGVHVVEAWATPLTDEGGKIATIVTAFQDISERRAIEQELASYRDHLEQRVAQRTAELAAVNSNLQARVAELSAINDISRTLGFITDLEVTLQHVVRILCDLYAVPHASISLIDRQRGALQVVAWEGRSDTWLRAFVDRLFPRTPSGSILLGQSPLVIEDIDQVDSLSAEMRADLRARGVARLLVAPLLARDERLGVITLISDDPAHRFSDDELRVAQTVAGQVAAALDIGRLIDETRRQRDVAEALRKTTSTLSRSLDQETVLATILQQLHQVLDYDGAAIALVEDAALVIVGAEGISAPYLGLHTPLTAASAGLQVLQRGAPLLIQDTRQSGDWTLWPETSPLRSWLGVPMVAGDQVVGVLNFDSSMPGAFLPSHAELLMTFADQAAIAVTNARLHQQAQVAAASSERERIARDLHDAVTQLIFSASLIAEALPMQLPAVSADVQYNLALLDKLTKGALAELRALLLELRPEHLTATPLDRLLNQLAEAFTGRMGTPVQVTTNCDPHYKPPPVVQVAVYRIAQEAMNNVAKHAQAQNVTINLTLRPGLLRLGILDDGRGFDARAQARERLGISIMQARAAEIGAQLTIDSAPGMGTQIFLVWGETAAD